MASIFADNSPQYEERTLEENDRYRIYTTGWGATLKQWKHATSTPEFMDFTINSKGMVAHLHSCGDINPLVPDLLEIGIDAINPLEVKAGMNPVALKQKYGNRVVLHGGINAVLWDQPEAIQAEMRAVIPVMKENGGYIFASDHSIPDSVSLEDFRGIIGLAKGIGSVLMTGCKFRKCGLTRSIP